MAYLLKDNISNRIKKLNISIAEFERMSGLKRNAIQNIIRGHSLHPSVKTLQKIAHTLDCSVDELIDNEVTSRKKHNNMPENKLPSFSKIEHHDLMNEIITYALKELKIRNLTPVTKEFFNAVSEIYDYCVEGQSLTFDARFTDWTLSKYFYKNNPSS